MDNSVIINQLRNVSSINEMTAAELYSASITTYMKNEIVYEIHDTDEYLTCVNDDDQLGKMQQQSEIKYFSNVLGNELTVFEATDDESMAVEALRQLGSVYSSNTVPLPEQNVSHLTCHQKFVCKFCAESFVALTELRSHITQNHPGDRPYKCHVCLQHFPRPSSLTNHLKIHTYQPGRALLVAGSKLAVPKQQVSSNKQVNNTVVKQQVNSELPGLKFENIDAIEQWPVEQLYLPDVAVNTAVTDTDPLATGNSFDSTSAFTTQITVNSDVETKAFACSECGAAFATKKSLAVHRKLHVTGATKYVCDTCSAVFASEVLHSEHRQHCTAVVALKKNVLQPLKHACADCEKRFATKQKMYRHMWIHRKKSYPCEHCPRTFELQPDLDKHRLSEHPADSPYVCQECGKSFASRQGLWEHGRLHGGGPAGTFTCSKCEKSFASRQGYLIHNRIHTGERPYGCRYCLKAFRDGGTLRKHERIHTGERPHVCPICKHDFNQKVVLREHVRWVHAATVAANKTTATFICQLCNVTVGDREELCAHIVRHSDQSRQNTTAAVSVSQQRRNKKQHIATTSATNQQQGSNECDMCGDKFASHDALMTHVNVHI